MNSRLTKKMKHRMMEIIVLLLAAINSIPLYLILTNAFKTNRQIVQTPFNIPLGGGFDNILRAFESMAIIKAYAVTLAIAAITISFLVYFCAMGAYAIARNKHWFFRSVYWFYTSLILMPVQAAFIPLIFMLKRFDLYNNILGISLAYISIMASFSIFMYVGFVRAISVELDESAKMEGSSQLRIFTQIIFPLLKPISVTLIIFQFVHIWDDLLLPLVMLNSHDYPTVTLEIYRFFSDLGLTDYSLLFGGAILVLTPIVILFLFLQRYFISDLNSGAIKG